MNGRRLTFVLFIATALMLVLVTASAQVTSDVPAKRADAIVDLGTKTAPNLSTPNGGIAMPKFRMHLTTMPATISGPADYLVLV
jgi:hypothetical protein